MNTNCIIICADFNDGFVRVKFTSSTSTMAITDAITTKENLQNK